MRLIYVAAIEKRRAVLLLTNPNRLRHLQKVVVAPITSTMRGWMSEVPVGPAEGLNHDSVISCDNIATLRRDQLGRQIGVFGDERETELRRALDWALNLDQTI